MLSVVRQNGKQAGQRSETVCNKTDSILFTKIPEVIAEPEKKQKSSKTTYTQAGR